MALLPLPVNSQDLIGISSCPSSFFSCLWSFLMSFTLFSTWFFFHIFHSTPPLQHSPSTPWRHPSHASPQSSVASTLARRRGEDTTPHQPPNIELKTKNLREQKDRMARGILIEIPFCRILLVTFLMHFRNLTRSRRTR